MRYACHTTKTDFLHDHFVATSLRTRLSLATTHVRASSCLTPSERKIIVRMTISALWLPRPQEARELLRVRIYLNFVDKSLKMIRLIVTNSVVEHMALIDGLPIEFWLVCSYLRRRNIGRLCLVSKFLLFIIRPILWCEVILTRSRGYKVPMTIIEKAWNS